MCFEETTGGSPVGNVPVVDRDGTMPSVSASAGVCAPPAPCRWFWQLQLLLALWAEAALLLSHRLRS